MLVHLQERGIASFTVDAVSNDSYISDPERLLQHALKVLEEQKGGIVLFHDIKPATARMLPKFLAQLQSRGYHVVHMRPKGQVAPLADYSATLAPLLAKSEKAAAASGLVPFYGALKPTVSSNGEPEPDSREPVVTGISPAMRPRAQPRAAKETTGSDGESRHAAAVVHVPRTAVRGWAGRGAPQADEH